LYQKQKTLLAKDWDVGDGVKSRWCIRLWDVAAEAFTGNMTSEEQNDKAVAFRISQGSRLEMPGDAQAAGLTGGMWKPQLLAAGSRNTTYDGRDFELMTTVRCTRQR